MQCDLCGKEEAMYEAEIEGTRMKVGRNCASFGKAVTKIRTESQIKSKSIPIVREEKVEPIKLIVKNYASLVKNAREKTGMKQEDFAKKMGEKVSVIHHIESGRGEPSIPLAQKLERTLGITLIEEYKKEKMSLPSGKNADMTIGSLVNIKYRKGN